MQRKIKFPLEMQRKINIFFLFTTFYLKKMKKCQIQKNTFLSLKCPSKKSYDDFKFFLWNCKGKLNFLWNP